MSHRTLTRSGYIVHKKYLTPIEINKIKKDLTVTPAVLPAFKDLAKPKPYRVYLESPERYYLPRHYGIENFGQPVNVNLTDGDDIDITVHMTLRPHQIAAAKNIMKQFNKPWPSQDVSTPSTGVSSSGVSTTSTMDTSGISQDEIQEEIQEEAQNETQNETQEEVQEVADEILQEIPQEEEKTEQLEYETSKITANGGGVLSLPCGYGKTVLAIWTIAQLKKKTLVIVNKEFLMDQWVDSFDKFSNARVGILQQNKMEIEGNDVVVGMLHSICMKEYPKGMFDSFGLVIFDECHHIASDMFSKSLPKVAAKYMLGLSATPERKDKLSRVFYYYLGKLFHQERRQGSNLVMVKQIQCMSGSAFYQDLYLRNGVKNTGGMLTQLIEFEERNRMIIHILATLVKQGRTTLVLSSRREHLEWIYDALQKANLRKPNGQFVTFGLYWGKQQMNKKQYKKMLEESSKCDIVLGTCQLAQEGLDIPTLDTLLFATPMTDIIQAVGRILRKYHAINPYVVDIVDKFGNFPKHLKQRQEFYDEEEYFCEKTNLFLFDNHDDNKYEDLVTAFLDHLPDLKEFEANRGQLSLIGKKHRKGPSPRLFILGTGPDAQGSGPGEDGEDFDDDLNEDSPTTIRLPAGCLIDTPLKGSSGGNQDGILDKRIPIKITPKLPSLINKVKISQTAAASNIPKIQITQNANSNVPKIQITPKIPEIPKIKVSPKIPETPKIKVNLNPTPSNITKIKVEEPISTVNKIKIIASDTSKLTKVKVSKDPAIITPKIKVPTLETVKIMQASAAEKIKVGEVNAKIQDELQNQKVKVVTTLTATPTATSTTTSTTTSTNAASSLTTSTVLPKLPLKLPPKLPTKSLPTQRKFF